MFLPPKSRKGVFLLFFIFISYFISQTLFLTLSYLLGGLIVGFALNGRKDIVSLILLLCILVLMLNEQIAVTFNLFYPFIFSGSIILLLKTRENISKGNLFFISTLLVSLFFVVYMSILEIKMGLITKTIEETITFAKETSTSIFKGIMDEKGLKEYQEFSSNLIKHYHPFLALLQFIIFGFLNLYLVLKIFNNLPQNLAEPFSKISINFSGVWFINLGMLAYILSEDTMISLAGMNVALYFLAFYFFQGIATANQFFAKFGIPMYVAFFFYFFFLANHIMWFLISLIGILDVQFDIKKRLKEA